MKKEYLPGWLLMLGVGLAATFLSRLIVIGGKHPVEAAVVAILLGIIIRNTISASFISSRNKSFRKNLNPGNRTYWSFS